MKVKNSVMDKMNTYEKAVKAIRYIILGAGLIMAIIMVAYICLYLLGRLTLPYKALGIELTTPGLRMRIDSTLIKGCIIPAQVSMILNAAMIWILLLYSVSEFLKVIKSIKENGTPFMTSVIKRIKYISYSFFFYSVISFFISLILKGIYSEDGLVEGISGISLQIDTGVPFWAIMCGIFILVIAEIFNYGLDLQQDNDSIV